MFVFVGVVVLLFVMCGFVPCQGISFGLLRDCLVSLIRETMQCWQVVVFPKLRIVCMIYLSVVNLYVSSYSAVQFMLLNSCLHFDQLLLLDVFATRRFLVKFPETGLSLSSPLGGFGGCKLVLLPCWFQKHSEGVVYGGLEHRRPSEGFV